MDLNYTFFLQAEDGIRDLTVTGVQTCALPILWRGRTARAEDSPVRQRHAYQTATGCAASGRVCHDRDPVAGFECGRLPTRSEERRVGKECRSRCLKYKLIY